MKRRTAQEREEADAREQAEARRLALLAELKAREAAGRPSAPPPQAETVAEGTDAAANAANGAAPESPADEALPAKPE